MLNENMKTVFLKYLNTWYFLKDLKFHVIVPTQCSVLQ